MKLATGILCAAAVASIAALVRAGDPPTHAERITSLEGQVSRLASTVASQSTRIQALERKLGDDKSPADAEPTPLPRTPPPAMFGGSPPEPSPSPAPQSRTVWVTKTGTKYHRAGCSYLRASGSPIPLDEAIRRGLTPCSRCGG